MKAREIIDKVCPKVFGNADAWKLYHYHGEVAAYIQNEISALILIQGKVKPYIMYANKYSQGGSYDYTIGRIYEDERWRNGNFLEAFELLKKGTVINTDYLQIAQKYADKVNMKQEKANLYANLKKKIEEEANGKA